MQDDVIKLRPPGVGIHFTRAAIADSITSESRACKPAVCSNQAVILDCLHLAGIDDRFKGYGRLLAEY